MKKAICLLLVILTNSNLLHAIDIYSHNITNIMSADNTGVYQKLLNLMSDQYGLEPARFFVQPVNRARRSFEANQEACYIAADLSWTIRVVKSLALGGFRVHFFTLKGQPIISSFSDVTAHKKIGGIVGFESFYASIMSSRHEIDYVLDDKKNMSKLKLGRVDALIGVLPDFKPYMEYLDYDREFILNEGLDYIFCHDNAIGNIYKDKFNSVLNIIKKNGEYKKVMGSLFLSVNFNDS